MQLSIAKKTAYELMKAENLLQKGWTCDFDDSKKISVAASIGKRK